MANNNEGPGGVAKASPAPFDPEFHDRTTFDPPVFPTAPSEEATRVIGGEQTAVPGPETASSRGPLRSPVVLAPDMAGDATIVAPEGDLVQTFRASDLLALAGQASSPKPPLSPMLQNAPVQLSRPAVEDPAERVTFAPVPAPPAAPEPPPPKAKRIPVADQSLFEGFDSLQFKGEPTPPPVVAQDPGSGPRPLEARARPVDPSDVRVTGGDAPANPMTTFDIPPALAMVLVPAPVVTRPPPAAVPAPVVAAPPVAAPPAPARPAQSRAQTPRPEAARPSPRASGPAPRATPKDGTAARASGSSAKDRASRKSAPNGSKEGVSNDELRSLAVTTDVVARVIPIVLMLFTVLAAIVVSVKLFSKDGSGVNQTHVQLRFVPIGQHVGPLVRPSLKPTRLSIDTIPTGLLVLYDGQVLGRTPFSADLPVELVGPVAAEISSPYYEAWVGEAQKDALGEYQIYATLRPR